MKLGIKQIITIALSLLAVVAGLFLFNSIKAEEERFQLIKLSEAEIKDNLRGLKLAQELHKKKYGNYSEDFNRLQDFVNQDTFFIVDINESIIERQYEDDSIVVTVDTVSYFTIEDSLYRNGKFKTLNKSNIAKVPELDHNFHMVVTNDTAYNEYKLYIVDTLPLDKYRRKPIMRNGKEKKIKGTKPLLSIGSTKDESLEASWAKQ